MAGDAGADIPLVWKEEDKNVANVNSFDHRTASCGLRKQQTEVQERPGTEHHG